MRAFVFLLLAMAVSATASAQELPRAAQPVFIENTVSEYQLGPGDLVSIRVSGVREFEQSARVSNSGRIRVPYVGVMFVADMTTFDLEREIARLIKEHELINEPTVRVQIEQHRAQPTYAIGEFQAPGQFVISGEMYLLDLLSKAGGLLGSADATAYLYRRKPLQPSIQAKILSGVEATPESLAAPDAALAPTPLVSPVAAATEDAPTENVIPIDLKALREGTQPELNMRLRGGDIFYVPRGQAQNFFVIGDVKVPGAYVMPRRGGVSAAQAVAYAGGPLPTAKNGKGFLMRHDDVGIRQAMPVDFSAILEGREPDFPIKPNDIIFIPNSAVKTVGVGLLNLVPLLVQQFLIF